MTILVDGIDEQWQADLLDLTWFSRFNDGVKFLFVVIDCLSRYAWVEPLKDKSALSVVAGFEIILATGRKPKKLQTDQGKEFVNANFNRLMKREGIHFFTTTDDQIKCAIVERLNRTLRNRIYRYLHYKNSHRYIDDLQKIVTGYNNSFHRAIKMKPSQVCSENVTEVKLNIKKTYKQKPHHKKAIEVGKTVRIARKKGTFEKGATSNWTEELFKVAKNKKTPSKYIYKLVDLDGEPITSIFYPEEVSEVKEKNVYKIEKVLKTGRNPLTRKTEYFVKWLGYPSKFNSWIENIDNA